MPIWGHPRTQINVVSTGVILASAQSHYCRLNVAGRRSCRSANVPPYASPLRYLPQHPLRQAIVRQQRLMGHAVLQALESLSDTDLDAAIGQ